MLKRVLIISILSLSIISLSQVAWATSAPNLSDTIYDIKGKLTLKINFPNLISLTVTLPDVYNFGEVFYFWDDGTFQDGLITALLDIGDTLPLQSDGFELPTWEQTGSNFIVDLTPIADSVSAMLSELTLTVGEDEYTMTGTARGSPTFPGKIATNGSISGSINLNWDITFESETAPTISGTLNVTLKYKGTLWEEMELLSSSKHSKTSAPLNIKKLILDTLTSVPLKGAMPQK